VPYEFFDQIGDISVSLSGATLPQLFAAAAAAFTDAITEIAGVEPRRPEEVVLDAPEIDLLLVDFLSELLYRFDTRSWLTSYADLELEEKDGGWNLQGTLRGERLDAARHKVKAQVKAVTYNGLHVREAEGQWTAKVGFAV